MKRLAQALIRATQFLERAYQPPVVPAEYQVSL